MQEARAARQHGGVHAGPGAEARLGEDGQRWPRCPPLAGSARGNQCLAPASGCLAASGRLQRHLPWPIASPVPAALQGPPRQPTACRFGLVRRLRSPNQPDRAPANQPSLPAPSSRRRAPRPSPLAPPRLPCTVRDRRPAAEPCPRHTMLLWHALLAASLPALAAAADPSDALRLLHRIHHPALDDPAPFVPRADLHLAAAALAPHESPLDLLRDETRLDGALYQIALEHPGDTSPAQWDVATVRAVSPAPGHTPTRRARAPADTRPQCHLLHGTAEDIRVHLTADGAPFALDYFVGPVPRDGACPRPRRGAPAPSLDRALNTTVTLVSPRRPPRCVSASAAFRVWRGDVELTGRAQTAAARPATAHARGEACRASAGEVVRAEVLGVHRGRGARARCVLPASQAVNIANLFLTVFAPGGPEEGGGGGGGGAR